MDVLSDRLTGLQNLIGLVDSLRSLPEAGVLIGIDLMDFATVNDRFGRVVGDRVLRTLAEALRDLGERCPQGCVPYRLGGDEFVIHVPGADTAAGVRFVAELAEGFATGLAAEQLPAVNLHSSLATYPTEGRSPAALLAHLEQRIAEGHARGHEHTSGQWIEGLLGWFITRLTETVDALRTTREMALTDPVSGMPNHRAAEEFIDRLLAARAASGTPFAVLFIDGDNLKSFNEKLGYEQGNVMLRALGGVIESNLRENDHVSRWLSGDEFLAILPGVETTAAVAVAERIRAAVAAASDQWALPTTVSIGAAACPADGCTVTELLSAAADANQIAKRQGKNRVARSPGQLR